MPAAHPGHSQCEVDILTAPDCVSPRRKVDPGAGSRSRENLKRHRSRTGVGRSGEGENASRPQSGGPHRRIHLHNAAIHHEAVTFGSFGPEHQRHQLADQRILTEPDIEVPGAGRELGDDLHG